MRYVFRFIYVTILLTVASLMATTAWAIEITLLPVPQTISQIKNVQQKLTMSKDPKKLSADPKVTCFQADISEFIPPNVPTPKPIFGCIFSDQVAMNAALLRAGLYVHTQAGMASDAELFGSNLMTAVGGHDFSGEQLAKYYAQVSISKDSAAEHLAYKDIEKKFNQEILQPILSQHQENFIFFAVINTKKFKENLSHELLHAQYYNVPQIADILEPIWNAATKKDQEIIVASLTAGGYDMDQHDLLLREFYSYFLQYNATKYLSGIKVLKPMAPLAKIYAPKISQALGKHDIRVLKVVK